MSWLNWFCIIYTIITIICFVYTLYAIKHAPVIDPQKPFLKGDISTKELNKSKEK